MLPNPKLAPTVTVQGNKIVISRTGGEANEKIDVAIFLAGPNGDVLPAADSKTANSDNQGDVTLTSAALAGGTYHVQTTTHPTGLGAVVYNNSVVILPPPPPPGP